MLTAMSGFTTQNCRVACVGDRQDGMKQDVEKHQPWQLGLRWWLGRELCVCVWGGTGNGDRVCKETRGPADQEEKTP